MSGERVRKSTEFFESAEVQPKGPRFDFSKGTGVKLSTLNSWVTGNRGKDADALETALEPLHRAIYGRAGVHGERRAALADYSGFPDDQLSIMKSKVTSWKKDQMKGLVQALDIPGVLISVPVADLSEGLLNFLRHPVKKELPKKVPRRVEAPAVDEASSEEAPIRKKNRVESEKANPHQDSILLEVYRRVLAMDQKRRATLSLKGLREEIAAFFGVDAAIIKEHSQEIHEAAVECVRALREAVEESASSHDVTSSSSEAKKEDLPTAAAVAPEETSASTTASSPA